MTAYMLLVETIWKVSTGAFHKMNRKQVNVDFFFFHSRVKEMLPLWAEDDNKYKTKTEQAPQWWCAAHFVFDQQQQMRWH